MMKKIKWLCSLGLIALLMSMSVQAKEALQEADIKAAFVFNFALLTEWPRVPEEEYVVCQFKNDLFNLNNRLLQQKTLNGKAIKWMLVERASELNKCQIVLIGQYKAQEIDSILGVLNNANVLTVTDSNSPLAQKAMISMVLENNLLGFDVNLKASKAANLQLSTKLLKLAKRVNL